MTNSDQDAPLTCDLLAPKSDQLNADDLVGGPRTITITRVSSGSSEQPRNIHYDGDNGRPWKPCKTMMRVLFELWGPSGYRGRQVTLVRDPSVSFGKNKNCGGIRISAMSHITEDRKVMVTISRETRRELLVRRLESAAPARSVPDKPRGDIVAETVTVPTWPGTLDELKAHLERFSWTKPERETLRGLIEQWTVSAPAMREMGDE